MSFCILKCTFAIIKQRYMANHSIFQLINDALVSNNPHKAHRLISIAESENGKSAKLFYLQGKTYMKESKWGEAISCFNQAEALDPKSPAHECRLMLNDIMAFFNKDMYNQ